ncbi:MAG: cytochrome P450, partial [Pseudomonadota bacterium]
ARRNMDGRRNDLLGMMLAARDPETGRTMSDEEIRDNLMTFIVAGSDTTALALTWAIYGLTQMPHWAERLRDEADKAFEATTNAATLPDHLPWTRRYLDEILRLFPSAPLVFRQAAEDDRICNMPVRRGDMILAPIYALHRNADLWPEPLQFDPARFDGTTRRTRFSYLPFGAGPRACIGAGFAMMEAVLTLAVLARRLEFKLQKGWHVSPLMMLTLKPDGGLPVRIRQRG